MLNRLLNFNFTNLNCHLLTNSTANSAGWWSTRHFGIPMQRRYLRVHTHEYTMVFGHAHVRDRLHCLRMLWSSYWSRMRCSNSWMAGERGKLCEFVLKYSGGGFGHLLISASRSARDKSKSALWTTHLISFDTIDRCELRAFVMCVLQTTNTHLILISFDTIDRCELRAFVMCVLQTTNTHSEPDLVVMSLAIRPTAGSSHGAYINWVKEGEQVGSLDPT